MRTSRKCLSAMLLFLAVGIVAYAAQIAWSIRSENVAGHNRRQVMRDMLASDDMALIILLPDGRICEWNAGAEKLLGWTEKEVIGAVPDFLMAPDVWAKHVEVFKGPPPTTPVTCVDSRNGWMFPKNGDAVPVHLALARFKNHVGYYSMALIAKLQSADGVSTPRPTRTAKQPVPTPIDVPSLPGIYHAFSE